MKMTQNLRDQKWHLQLILRNLKTKTYSSRNHSLCSKARTLFLDCMKVSLKSWSQKREMRWKPLLVSVFSYFRHGSKFSLYIFILGVPYLNFYIISLGNVKLIHWWLSSLQKIYFLLIEYTFLPFLRLSSVMVSWSICNHAFIRS